jgi:hypothetical protein
MKSLLFLVLILCGRVFAGHETGNGGNVIICYGADEKIISIETLDYYEMRLMDKHLMLNSNLEKYDEKLFDLFQKWEKVAPKRMALYKKWLMELNSEAGFYSNIEIPEIPDTGSIAIPRGCKLIPAAFQRKDADIFPGVKRYVVRKDFWDLMDEEQKAGLILHELIYREAMGVFHKTSAPTRFLNGYLATTEPNNFGYTSLVVKMPLEWVEYGGGLVLRVGENFCPDAGANCYFRRVATITDDLQTMYTPILDVIGDIKTDELQIEFWPESAEQPRPKKENCHVAGQSFMIYPNSGFDFNYSCLAIKNIHLKDYFQLSNLKVFINGAGKFSYTMNHFDFFGNVDPESSWLKTKTGELLQNIEKVGTDNFTTSDGTEWKYSGNFNWEKRVEPFQFGRYKGVCRYNSNTFLYDCSDFLPDHISCSVPIKLKDGTDYIKDGKFQRKDSENIILENKNIKINKASDFIEATLMIKAGSTDYYTRELIGSRDSRKYQYVAHKLTSSKHIIFKWDEDGGCKLLR